MATLATGLFEHHNRSTFETFGFSFKSDGGDDMQRRIRAAFDHFTECQELTENEAHARANQAGLDIAVDLMGYTSGNRTELFARRMAPIQVNYLGYPGTMGAPFIDYIVGDEFVIPAGQEAFFTEKIVRLPECFQINDDRRSLPAAPPARATLGLPADGFVYCCFNTSYKLNPEMFDIWMRLLRATEGSVLWLVTPEIASENLRREASLRGIDPQRIVFSPRIDYRSYLARYGAADLFLDTLPFNGGTTASDALWAGLPVLTCAGQAFASRMAGSLLRAVGLAELITGSVQEYEALALALAQDPDRLAKIKRKLIAGRSSAPLFNTQRITRHLEDAYQVMHARHRAGLPPADISVPGL